jgi:hypothetical protein
VNSNKQLIIIHNKRTRKKIKIKQALKEIKNLGFSKPLLSLQQNT